MIGAGPTGAELAGTLAEIARHTLTRDFRHIDTRKARILLIEAGPRVLSAFTEALADKARRQLERLGVEVHTGKPVTEIGADFLEFGDQRIAARTILWAAGVAASPLGKQLGAELDRAGRVRVQPDLSLAAHPEVFVAGDLASVEQDGKPVPGVAPAAKQMGARVAKNILARIAGRKTTPFHYTDFGALATIGRHSAIAQLPNLRFSGMLAWWFWLALHIYFLIGFRSRLIVLINWAWAYFTYARGARIILGNEVGKDAWPRKRKQRLSRGEAQAHKPKLAPNAVKRGLSATEVALALDHEDIAAVVELVRKAGGAPLGAYREPLGRPPAAARVAAVQRGAAHALSARSVAHARQAARRRHRSHRGVSRSAHRRARRRRPLLDAERPPSPGRREGARSQADHRAHLAG